MPANKPDGTDITDITQEALLEQLKRQHERICLLEAQIAERQIAERQPETSSEHADAPAPENWMAPEEVTEWPDPPPANLSQWLGYYTESFFDKADFDKADFDKADFDKADTHALSSAPDAPETVAADEAGSVEPTLRFDGNRLRRAHRRLETEPHGTGWRTSLTMLGLGVVALAFVLWQQHPGVMRLSASTTLQASIASPDPAAPLQAVSRLPGPPVSLTRASPRSAAHAALAVSHVPGTPAEISSVRLAQMKQIQRGRHSIVRPAVPSAPRLAFAAAQKWRLASADIRSSALPETRSSFASRFGQTHTPIATAALANGKRTRLLSRASVPASHTVPRRDEPGSNRADLSEQEIRNETPGNETATVAETPNDIQPHIDQAIHLLDKMCDELDVMEQHRKRVANQH